MKYNWYMEICLLGGFFYNIIYIIGFKLYKCDIVSIQMKTFLYEWFRILHIFIISIGKSYYSDEDNSLRV